MKVKRITSEDRIRLTNLAIPKILSYLTEKDSLDHYTSNLSLLKDPDKLTLGYSFLITSAIERLIDAILVEPAFFGLKENKLVERAFQKDVPLDEFPNRSDIGKIVRHLAFFYKELLSVRTVADLRVKTERIRSDLLPILIQWENCFHFSADTESNVDLSEILKVFAAMYIRDNYHDIAFVNIALNHTFNRAKQYQPRFHELPVNMQSQKFFDGFKLGVSYLWYRILGPEGDKLSFMTLLSSAKTWDEFYECHPIVNQVVKASEDSLLALSYFIEGAPNFKGLVRAPAREKKVNHNLMDRLDERFQRFDVRLVSEMYTAKVATGLMQTLLGILQFRSEKARVIRFVHPEQNGRNRYSYAVFVHIPIMAGDESEWWLFFDFCDDYSERGLSGFLPVENMIRNNKRIEVTSFKIMAGELMQYVFTKPDFSKSIMDPLMREFNNLGTLSGLRILLAGDRAELGVAKGFLLELLAINTLTRMGYQTKWRFSRSFIGKEIDVLAFKLNEAGEGELIIAECSTIFSPALIREVKEKLELVKSRLDDILKVFPKVTATKINARGWLVTSDPVNFDISRVPADILVQDWGKIVDLCNSSSLEIPAGVKEVLTSVHFPPAFVIRPSSIQSVSSPPPLPKGEKPRILYLVADKFMPPKKWSVTLNRRSK